MYGTYLGFNLPLNTLAALVASRPRVWPLASTTYHLRSMSLPLGTNVDILFLPLDQFCRRANPGPPNIIAHSAFSRARCSRAKIPPTAKQFCSGEDYGAYPLRDPDSAEPEPPLSRRCLSSRIPTQGFNQRVRTTANWSIDLDRSLEPRYADPRRNTAQG